MVPEGRRLFSRMSVRENLTVGAMLRTDKDGIQRDMDACCSYSPGSRSASGRRPAACPVVSSRCSPWAAP